jgi:hypothetical protein
MIGYHNNGGYKLLNPLTKQIVIRRDVIFDEMKKWDWSKSEKKDSVSIVYEELESNGVEANQNEERRPSRTRQMPTRLQEFEITRLQGY